MAVICVDQIVNIFVSSSIVIDAHSSSVTDEVFTVQKPFEFIVTVYTVAHIGVAV